MAIRMSVETEVQLLILDQPPHTFSRPERDLNVLIRLRSASTNASPNDSEEIPSYRK